MIAGKEVEIGGKKYTLPPLNVTAIRKHSRFLGSISSFKDGVTTPTAEDILEMSAIVLESLVRNYPEIRAEEIEEYLDIDKIVETFVAVVAPGKDALAGRTDG